MAAIAVRGPLFRAASSGAAGDDRFWFVHRPPHGTVVRGAVLAVHAFAEELNKTRAAVADGARALAAAGFVVLQVDLKGCGDSAGDFEAAGWDDWLADLDVAWRWLGDEAPAPRWLWGTRLGALLADDVAAVASPPVDGMLLWQPVINGAQHLGQFLRLKTASNMLRQAGGPARTASPANGDDVPPRVDLAAGRPVEVAGYRLTPALADAVERARLGAHDGSTPRSVRWFDVSSQPDAALSPIALRLVERWRAAGCDVATEVVPGPAFWQTQEVERCPALVDATVAALSG